MKSQKVSFQNKKGDLLFVRFEFPADRDPHNYAIFAHCFTCSKDFSATRNVSRALASEGFGVLRFDFTGLGNSEGDFSETNFSSNVDDIVAAAGFLAEEFKAASLLVGHSLGGAAAIFAGSRIESVQAVATIGAPSNPAHVQKQLGPQLETIVSEGEANVQLAGREFTFKRQFVEDLVSCACAGAAKKLRKALLIMHSPEDATVAIGNAEEIYHAARHPKSFVTLSGSEHLLIDKKNAAYVGKMIAGWAARYIPMPQEDAIQTSYDVVASLDDDDGFTTQLKLGTHYLKADEPENVGGNNYGPTPYELLAGSLSACTAMTIQMYARRKGWKIDNVEVHTSYSREYARDCADCSEDNATKIDTFVRDIRLESDLDEAQIKRVLQIADKCPVHKTLHSEVQIITKLKK
ncbi:MAG: bifunctional alpha/beta hydrolase/OsmC family protein [Bacteroidota bacterium]